MNSLRHDPDTCVTTNVLRGVVRGVCSTGSMLIILCFFLADTSRKARPGEGFIVSDAEGVIWRDA